MLQKESYLRALARYIVLNPVRASIVSRPEEWEWSSYRFMLGEPAPSWISTEWLLSCFGSEQVAARSAYQNFVTRGSVAESPFRKLRFQCIRGADAFVAQHRAAAEKMMSSETSKAQRRAHAMSLDEYALKFTSHNIAMAEAYKSTASPMTQIAVYFASLSNP